MRKASSISCYIISGLLGFFALILCVPNDEARTPMVDGIIFFAALAFAFFALARRLGKPRADSKRDNSAQRSQYVSMKPQQASTDPAPHVKTAQATSPESLTVDPAGVLSAIMPSANKAETNPSKTAQLSSSPLHLWGSLPVHFEAVGEYYHQKEFNKIFANHPNFTTYGGAEIKAEVLLVPEPNNRYDRNAVAITYQGMTLGYMAAEDAAIYHKPIAALGSPLSVPGRIWASKDGSGTHARVTFTLTEPQNLNAAALNFRDDEIEIPYGEKMHVIGEEQFMAALRDHVPEHGEKRILVRLRKSIDFRPKSARERVDVFIGDERIGWLSDQQSANMLPIVKLLEEHNRVGAARATIGGSVLKAEVFLYAARANEISAAWVSAVKMLPSAQEAREAEWDW